jgi:hypothetical protein
MANDLSSALYAYLTEAEGAAPYRALVGQICEAGFIDADLLTENENQRRLNKGRAVLAASVQDAGDYPIPVGNEGARVVIRHYDRGYGYRNLREARNMLREVLRGFTTVLDAVAGRSRGVIELNYGGRTGHRRDRMANCDWEGLTYIGTIIVED